MLPRKGVRIDVEMFESGLPRDANLSMSAHEYSAYDQLGTNVVPWA